MRLSENQIKDPMQNANNGSIPKDIAALSEPNEVALNIRTQLGHELREILIQKRLKQRELAILLAIQQPEVSHLFNGHFSRFTIDKLIQFFDRLGWVVEIKMYPPDID
ncbi:MAG: helix-turn-helix transcriptional regulator [Cyanobacteria bacterium P01_B01_bin.77]